LVAISARHWPVVSERYQGSVPAAAVMSVMSSSP
jgi:hypothetical protein